MAAAGFDTVYLHADVECWLVPDTRVVGVAFVVRDAKDQDCTAAIHSHGVYFILFAGLLENDVDVVSLLRPRSLVGRARLEIRVIELTIGKDFTEDTVEN